MNAQTLHLLEKALAISPEDWETRAHLMEAYLADGKAERAKELLNAAPSVPQTEAAMLGKARVELETDMTAAQQTLQQALTINRGSAQAYLLFAKLFLRRGLLEEARRKYGAATVIDESLRDAELEKALQLHAEKTPTPAPAQGEPTATEADFDAPEAAMVSAEETAAAMKALADETIIDKHKVTFADIGGMESVIERVRMNIIYPFKNPEVFQKFKKKPGGGILMYGPPGCGKTYLARATAGECGATFISIAITDILSKWLGESERHLHEIFETARRRSPTVIFIDEVDAIGVKRADASSSMAPIVNTLLAEMDGVSANNENLMVLAATNAPWRVDGALRRPGRFDRVLFVPPPDAAAREAILRLLLRELPVESIDISKIAKETERFSGADLRAAVERSSESAIMEEMRSGKAAKISQRDLLAAAKSTKPSTGEWLETARSYATYGNRAGTYDDLVAYFESH